MIGKFVSVEMSLLVMIAKVCTEIWKIVYLFIYFHTLTGNYSRQKFEPLDLLRLLAFDIIILSDDLRA